MARLNPTAKHGRAFGSYGFYKSIGYTLGPLLGGVLVWAGGLRLLFVVMTLLGAGVAVWAALSVPSVPPLPRQRQTVVDLARRLIDPAFLAPTAALAGATAALSVAVGFLPVSGRAAGLSTIATGAAVSVLALCAALIQPRAGRALDAGRLTTRAGLTTGLLITAVGLTAAMLPGLYGILIAAVLIGLGTGLITPAGFAALAASTPPERLGQTMGTAELGRELGDAGGPLLVAGVASLATLTYGFGTLALLLAAGAGLATARGVNERILDRVSFDRRVPGLQPSPPLLHRQIDAIEAVAASPAASVSYTPTPRRDPPRLRSLASYGILAIPDSEPRLCADSAAMVRAVTVTAGSMRTGRQPRRCPWRLSSPDRALAWCRVVARVKSALTCHLVPHRDLTGGVCVQRYLSVP